MKNNGMRILVAVMLAAIVFLMAVMCALTARSLSKTKSLTKEVKAMQTEIEALNEKLGSPVAIPAEVSEITEAAEDTGAAAEEAPQEETVAAETPAEEVGGEIEAPDIFPEDTYNYLALGNSITQHEPCSYWWGDWGMCASAPDKDYAHQTAAGLEVFYGPVTYKIVNFSAWELQTYDRAETLMTLDNYLDPDLNLVTIQLGENCYDMSTLKDDYIEMIDYIKNKVPGVHVMLLGDVWNYPPRDTLKYEACTATEIPYADMSGMRDNPLYQAGLGTIVWGVDGQQHMIEHSGAAKHPSDAGMLYMADVILHSLNYWDSSIDYPMPTP